MAAGGATGGGAIAGDGTDGGAIAGRAAADGPRPLDAEGIYRSADEALYPAKRTGTGIALAKGP